MSKLKQFREYLNLSVVELADKVGLTRQALYQYETDLRKIPPEVQVKLAHLGLNLHWLATGEGLMLKDDAIQESNIFAEAPPVYRNAKVTSSDLALAAQWLDEMVLQGRKHDEAAKMEWILFVAETLAADRFDGLTVQDSKAKILRFVQMARVPRDSG